MHLSSKKNWFAKNWLKFTNRKKYKEYKSELNYYTAYHKTYERINQFVSDNKDSTVDEIFNKAKNCFEINVVHSGNAGDIIYSLPVVKKLSAMTFKPVNF